jgi:uncharacterized membrane protein
VELSRHGGPAAEEEDSVVLRVAVDSADLAAECPAAAALPAGGKTPCRRPKRRDNGGMSLHKRPHMPLPRETKLTRELLNEHFHSNLHFSRGWADTIAEFLTLKFGTITFLALNAVFFFAWITYNTGWYGTEPYDPYPFNFLTMTVSLEAIFLSVIVLISQNRQSKIADIRQQMDFEIDVRSEEEITKMLWILDEMRHASGIKGRDRELEAMKKNLDLQKIQQAAENHRDD